MIKGQLGGSVLALAATLWVGSANATVMEFTLGNTSPGFNDGDAPATFLVGAAQGGQPVPFDQGYGTDGLFGTSFSASWTHSYAAVSDPILSASISFGIVDHDSSASGSQVLAFSFEGADLTGALDALFEAPGEGADLQYDIYTLTLPAFTFAGLADGSALASLSLQGPGLVTPVFPLPGPNPPVETTTNGANLIFATLSIETQDTVNPVPAPGSLALLGLGLALLARNRHGRRMIPRSR